MNINHITTDINLRMDRIKTKLKFVKSDRTGSWVGFVSINPKNGRVFGVREDDKNPKKVCVASREVACFIEPGVLYDVQLIPMKNKSAGYIVVEAEPHAFEAKITPTVIKNVIYKVEVKFGNKTLLFDPKEGKLDSVRDLDKCAEMLKKRMDVKNLLQVVDDFLKVGQTVLSSYQNDQYEINKKRLLKKM